MEFSCGVASDGPYTDSLVEFRGSEQSELAGTRDGVRAGGDAELAKDALDVRTRQLLGVHIFGTSATELVHIGQTVMAGGLGVDYLVDSVFNVPTFSDAYKVAALDAVNRLNEICRGEFECVA